MLSDYRLVRAVRPSTFDPYLGWVASYLGFESSTQLLDGIGEIRAGGARVSFAIRRDISFAALRWVESGADRCEVQTFFVHPATKSAHAMISIRSVQSRSSTDIGQQMVTQFGEVVDGTEVDESVIVPDFTQLVSLLSSDGLSAPVHGELLSRIRNLESELEYARIAAEDQRRELATARENLKLMSIGAGPDARRALFHTKSTAAAASVPETNDSLAGLPGWAQRNVERIVVLPRALSGAKKSQYESPETVMAALEFLAGPYRDLKRGVMTLAEFDETLKQQTFQLANSVGVSVAGEQGEQYYVRWAGRRVLMDQHVLKGGGREPRYCMRIYFFWDPDSARAVVGVLPHHLENSLT
ncbi:hypothetical protein [Burkholderia sp. Ac-20365]|uniref:hypothetical protein n=1 Tax=Burkholderia sp. Ac-20365 TaxID=2703897 RepID=UPI00197B34CA|nr:hypothetical protein [Burkholderia sp. Ac-20365]MBN3761141.1 hypothetical protein [Burkholderia sp. Ac-20365]